MISLKILMSVTSGLIKTCCFKIYRLLAKRQFFKSFFIFRFQNESKNLANLSSHLQFNEAMGISFSWRTYTRSKIVTFIDKSQTNFLLLCRFPAKPFLRSGNDKLCLSVTLVIISNTVQMFNGISISYFITGHEVVAVKGWQFSVFFFFFEIAWFNDYALFSN